MKLFNQTMTAITQQVLSKLLSLSRGERIEIMEYLLISLKEESIETENIPANQPDLNQYFGTLPGVFGDGVGYQKRVRDEW